MTLHDTHTRIACLALLGLVFSAAPGPAADAVKPATDLTVRMTEFMEAKQLSGSVTLVATRDQILHHQALGFRDLASGSAMTPDSIFRIASMTKPITATAFMILQDEGKADVNDAVAKYLPEFRSVRYRGQPLPRPLTIKHLLTHTAGVQGPGHSQASIRTPLVEQARKMAAAPLLFKPGSQWKYSAGLNAVGRIIEVVSGVPYENFVAERIFKPLGMDDTTFVLTPAQAQRLATLYRPDPDTGALTNANPNFLSADPTASITPNPSGGLYSTARDMARFYQAILNGGARQGVRIVSQASVTAMTQVHTPDLTTGFTPGNGWGLGWCIVRQPQGVTAMLSPGTYGHGGAFGTQGWVDPERGLIFVLMIQRTQFGNSDASDIRRVFQQTLVDTLNRP
jgi:CubicO group peptidase (beta-lactamase class C family)